MNLQKDSFIKVKKTYYIDENGRMAKGWQKIKDKYYYFNRDSGIKYTIYGEC